MDSDRFDALTTTLSALRTRRAAITAAAGSLLAVVLGRQEVGAACVNNGKKCKGKNGKEKNCCGGARCVGKTCRCTNGKKDSGGVCAKKPVCRSQGIDCISNSSCCSQNCGFFGLDVCAFSAFGERCLNDDDCLGDMQCVGFKCRGQI